MYRSKPSKTEWIRLDNASKVFPPNHNSVDTKVFRVSVELTEEVDPEALQAATEATYEAYPLLQYVLRQGVFWYYLQRYDLEPIVEEESLTVCATLYKSSERSLLFRVNYFRRRINLEIFHVLTDGTGAFFLFQELIYRYLMRVHPPSRGEIIKPPNDRASLNQLMQDSFRKYYSKGQAAVIPDVTQDDSEEAPPKLGLRAVLLKGRRNPDYHLTVIEGEMSAKAVLDLAHSENTTLTIYLAALWIQCMDAQVPVHKKGPMALSIPVNLRQYFPSFSARNFFATIRVGHDTKLQGSELSQISTNLKRHFRKELQKEALQKKLNKLMSIERNPFIRIIPIFLKDPIMNLSHRIVDRTITSSVSNLGRIQFPEALAPYIDRFSVCTSARRPQMCCCTWGDKLVVSFTTPNQETEAIRAFFTTLSGHGIHVEVTSNKEVKEREGALDETL